MLYGLYVSAAGALANSFRQDVIANNLANVSTIGFRADLARVMSSEVVAPDGYRARVYAVNEDAGVDLSHGSHITTERNLDVAINGERNLFGATWTRKEGRWDGTILVIDTVLPWLNCW